MPRELFNSALYVESYGLVRSYVLSRSGNDEDVRDTLQEGFYIYFGKAKNDDLILECKLASYILGICKNVWKKELKKRQAEVLSDTFDDVEDRSEERLQNKEKEESLRSILRRCILKLTSRCQDVLDLGLEGISCEEIAEIMNLDNGNITSNKTFTCKLRLKTLVQQDPEYIRIFNSN